MNHLLQSFAGSAVNCGQPETETVARVANESGNDRATIRFTADLESHIRRDPGIFAQSMQPTGLMNLIATQEIEIWSLLQSDLQSKAHAVTQSSVGGLIIHVGKNEGVGGRKRNPTVKAPVKRACGKENQDRRSHRQPTSCRMNATNPTCWKGYRGWRIFSLQGLRNAFPSDWGDEPISPARQSLNILGVLSGITDSFPQYRHRHVNAAVKIHNSVIRPEHHLDLIPGHQSAPALDENSKNLKWLLAEQNLLRWRAVSLRPIRE